MSYTYINRKFALARYHTNGNLDTSFSNDGMSTELPNAGISGLAIDANGRIVAAGSKDVGGYMAWALARFTPSGTLDSAFSNDGWLVENYGVNAEAIGNAVYIDSAGKIVMAGYATIPPTLSGKRQFVLARYTPNGILDAGFSGDGKVQTDFNHHEGAFSVAIDANGKIVAAGRALSGNGFAVARYNPDGNLDATFLGGKLITTFAGATHAGADAVAIDTNGKIVAAGFARINNVNQLAITRYNPDGTLDGSFSGGGSVTTSFGAGTHAGAHAVAIGGGNKIVAAGYAQSGGIDQFAIARYNLDGTLDNSFSGDGKLITSFGLNIPSIARSVTIDPNARIVVAGEATLSGRYRFALARYMADGSLDGSFSGDGKLTTEFIPGGGAVAYDVAIDAGGKIVAGGWAAEWGELPPG